MPVSPVDIPPMDSPTVVLDGRSLSIADVVAVARRGARVALAPEARERLARVREIVDGIVERNEVLDALSVIALLGHLAGR